MCSLSFAEPFGFLDLYSGFLGIRSLAPRASHAVCSSRRPVELCGGLAGREHSLENISGYIWRELSWGDPGEGYRLEKVRECEHGEVWHSQCVDVRDDWCGLLVNVSVDFAKEIPIIQLGLVLQMGLPFPV